MAGFFPDSAQIGQNLSHVWLAYLFISLFPIKPISGISFFLVSAKTNENRLKQKRYADVYVK